MYILFACTSRGSCDEESAAFLPSSSSCNGSFDATAFGISAAVGVQMGIEIDGDATQLREEDVGREEEEGAVVGIGSGIGWESVEDEG